MFNSYSITHRGVSNNLTFNSTSGTLVKSTENSKMSRFHMNSDLATCFFHSTSPNRGRESLKIVVLQVMLCGGDNFLVEYLDIQG